jgi:hypothetical protein
VDGDPAAICDEELEEPHPLQNAIWRVSGTPGCNAAHRF